MVCGPSQDLMSTARSADQSEEGKKLMPVWRVERGICSGQYWGRAAN
jgi:hypothetical protein